MNDIKCLDPHESLSFQKSPKLNMSGFSDVQAIECKFYRLKARAYIQPIDEDALEQLKIRVQWVQDILKSQKTHLPKLHQLAFDFAFLPPSSASVGRTFSYFKKW